MGETGKQERQDCTKRNIVYETWCLSCERRDREKIENSEEDEGIRKEKLKNLPLYKYIGESSRSIYERGLEHQRDLEEMKLDSHMLKHYFDKHGEEEIKFGARVLRQASTAFNRQISESVLIQNNTMKHHIWNSKSEYNRCALPRLSAKLGE